GQPRAAPPPPDLTHDPKSSGHFNTGGRRRAHRSHHSTGFAKWVRQVEWSLSYGSQVEWSLSYGSWARTGIEVTTRLGARGDGLVQRANTLPTNFPSRLSLRCCARSDSLIMPTSWWSCMTGIRLTCSRPIMSTMSSISMFASTHATWPWASSPAVQVVGSLP